MLNCNSIKLPVVKLIGAVLIIPSNIYGVGPAADTVTILLFCAIVVVESLIFIICIVPVPDAYITL
jgi:hypothetical protein